MRVWERLGADKPHKTPDVKDEKKENEATRPLSPVEPGTAAVASALPIQVKTDGEGETVKTSDTVAVKDSTVGAQGSAKTQNGRPSATQTLATETPARKGGRGRKKADNDLNHKPYAGLFEATFVSESGTFEVKDLRTGIEVGQEKWNEETFCLVCGTRIA